MQIEKIISGGQTGADRAGLDFAIANGISHGGWCPAGRLAEDGPISSKYNLIEMKSPKYPPRTEKNVKESDGTIIFCDDFERGCVLTNNLCIKHSKPVSIFKYNSVLTTVEATKIEWFITANNIKILNIAGNRESKCPGIHDYVFGILSKLPKTMFRTSLEFQLLQTK